MLRTVGMILYVAGYLISHLPMLLKAKLLEKDPEKHAAYCRNKIVTFIRRCNRVMGMQVELRGVENIPDHATLTVYNHQSLLDAFVLIAHMPNTESMVAKKELEKAPLLSNWMKAGKCIFIDRSSPRSGMLCIKQGAELLANNINVTIAPEGTRNNGGELLEFKAGAFKMATRAEVPVLPLCIEGTAAMFEANGKKLRPGKVLVTILPPVPTKGLTKEEQKELPAKVREQIRNVLEENKK
ncbi:MAG: 1-acyl-sn-glycerol-3-phosphate acyltransferase [Clostridia bacterium]|nr:1-acyl-sn-glycerol-3-phosphate acyltransferase [Clostridia bacterium]